MIHRINYNNALLAIIISHKFSDPGLHFITPPELSQQLGYIRQPAGKMIEPHVHKSVAKEVYYTQEVIFRLSDF